MTDTFCPKHWTLEDVECREPIVDCPPRVVFDPDLHVIVSCGPCNKVRVVPVSRIMQGKVPNTGPCCLSECPATVLHPQPEMKVETRTEYVEKEIPEGHVLVHEEVYKQAIDKAWRYDDLNDDREPVEEATDAELEGTKENPGHDPDTATKAGGIDQAAPSRAGKGKATSGEPKK